MSSIIMATSILFWSIPFFNQVANAGELSAKEIMEQNEERRKISDLQSSATLTTGATGDERGSEKVKHFNWWRKLGADQISFRTLTRFQTPAEIRGEGILFLEHTGGENEVLLYLPHFKKIRRVESQAQSGSFMGSELSYSDIAYPHIPDFTYKLMEKEPCERGGKVLCHVIECTPGSESIRERTGYSKMLSWVREDNRMIQRSEYYDFEGVLFKKVEPTENKLVDPAKNTWMAHKIRIDNVKTKRFTVLQFKDVKVNVEIEDSIFTPAFLSRVR